MSISIQVPLVSNFENSLVEALFEKDGVVKVFVALSFVAVLFQDFDIFGEIGPFTKVPGAF